MKAANQTVIGLVPGLPRPLLIEEIHFHLRHGEASRRALAFYLLDMEQRREHQALGYSSTALFAELALELPRRERASCCGWRATSRSSRRGSSTPATSPTPARPLPRAGLAEGRGDSV